MQHGLVIELEMVDRHIEQPGADIAGLPEVELVVCAPESGEDGGDVVGPVLHDVDLQAGSLLPLPNGPPLPRPARPQRV